MSQGRAFFHGPNSLAACAALVVAVTAAGVLPVHGLESATVLYVDDDASSGGDGSSWDAAFKNLQDAIEAAPGRGVSEIRIAQGVYTPDRGGKQIPGDINATFLVPSGVSIRGGYAGPGAKDPDARDFDLYRTILSGDLQANDGAPGSFENYEDNSYHIMTCIDGEPTTLIEGLVFTSSQAEGFDCTNGGGLVADGGSLQLALCTFEFNDGYGGGGAFIVECAATVIECDFISNRTVGAIAGTGAGLKVLRSECLIENCEFRNNRCQFSDGAGIAVIGNGPSTVTVNGCRFDSNHAENDGGAIFWNEESTVLVTDTQFIANVGDTFGGAVKACGSGTIKNCVFRDNVSGTYGGAIHSATPLVVISSDFIHNGSSTYTVRGGAINGGGEFVHCRFVRNTADFLGSPASAYGGGVYLDLDSRFTGCVFNSNFGRTEGGGAYIELGVSASFINCVFVNNTALDSTGGAISGLATIRNSIVWDNSPDQLDNVLADVTYSCIQDGWPGEGNFSSDPLFQDPVGPDNVSGTDDDDLRVNPQSPCIDAADNTRLPSDSFDLDGDKNLSEAIPMDLAGNRRFIDRHCTADTGNPDGIHFIVDMGPYEHVPSVADAADITCDGFVNVDDLLAVINSWGACTGEPTACPADIAPPGGNGVVNVDDLLGVINGWH